MRDSVIAPDDVRDPRGETESLNGADCVTDSRCETVCDADGNADIESEGDIELLFVEDEDRVDEGDVEDERDASGLRETRGEREFAGVAEERAVPVLSPPDAVAGTLADLRADDERVTRATEPVTSGVYDVVGRTVAGAESVAETRADLVAGRVAVRVDMDVIVAVDEAVAVAVFGGERDAPARLADGDGEPESVASTVDDLDSAVVADTETVHVSV